MKSQTGRSWYEHKHLTGFKVFLFPESEVILVLLGWVISGFCCGPLLGLCSKCILETVGT